ncbi:O-antigen ligase family protein [Patescibacteria group bacterium]|nr:O-antigen ligase family protein [Patescibacteria group bacterium]
MKTLSQLLKISIFTTIFLSPLYIIRWSYWGLPTTLLEHLIGLTVLIWLVFRMGKGKSFSDSAETGLNPFQGLTLFLLLACIISLFKTPDLRAGLGIFKAYFIEPIIFFYVLTDCLKRGIIKRKEIIWALTCAALWLSLIGISQILFKWPVFAIHEATGGRAHATFNSGNALALYIGPIIALLLALEIGAAPSKGPPLCAVRSSAKNRKIIRKGKPRIFEGLVLILITFVLILTKSTGGLVGLGVSIAFLVSARFLSLKLLRKLIITGAMLYLISHFVLLSIIPKLTPQVANPWVRPGGTGLTRLCVWEGTVNLLKDNPMLGAGLSGFKELYSTQYYTCDAEPLEYPHNFVLNFWTETGILGLTAIIGIIALVFYRELKKGNKSKINWGILAALIYCLAHGLVDVPYFKNDLALVFWVIIALVETGRACPPTDNTCQGTTFIAVKGNCLLD